MRRSDVNYKLSAAAFYQSLWIIYVGTVNFSVFRRRRIAFSPFSSYNRIKDVLKEETMKTKEDLTALREEVEALGEKLAELSDDELAEVSGGVDENTILSKYLKKIAPDKSKTLVDKGGSTLSFDSTVDIDR